MDLAALRTALKRYGFDDTDPIDSWINVSMHDIETAYEWPWMVDNILTTISVSGSNFFAITGIGRRVLNVQVTTPNTLGENTPEFLSASEFDGLDNLKTAAYPTYWSTYELATVFGIRWWPACNGTSFTLRTRVIRAPSTDLVNTGDVPTLVPTDLHYAIVVRAASLALKAENEEDRAKAATDDYETRMVKAVEFYGRGPSGQGNQVKDVQGYRYS